MNILLEELLIRIPEWEELVFVSLPEERTVAWGIPGGYPGSD